MSKEGNEPKCPRAGTWVRYYAALTQNLLRLKLDGVRNGDDPAFRRRKTEAVKGLDDAAVDLRVGEV
jgi:hypothetical protein